VEKQHSGTVTLSMLGEYRRVKAHREEFRAMVGNSRARFV
jgi:GTP cyclohydrolase I